MRLTCINKFHNTLIFSTKNIHSVMVLNEIWLEAANVCRIFGKIFSRANLWNEKLLSAFPFWLVFSSWLLYLCFYHCILWPSSDTHVVCCNLLEMLNSIQGLNSQLIGNDICCYQYFNSLGHVFFDNRKKSSC